MPPFLVDGTNVYASRPDGWRRNRERAAARLVAELDFACETAAETCIVVFDRLPRDQWCSQARDASTSSKRHAAGAMRLTTRS